ncbi:MAG: aminotransferase class I/II-fold pyridoxal phosphate-dependent enzyme [Solibacillus sp.]
MQLPAHGANATALYKALGLEVPQHVIDVSENVNSAGLPPIVREQWGRLLEVASSYPNEQAEPFRSTVANAHGVVTENIVVTNGAAEGLMALAQRFSGLHIALLEPSFSEYRRTLLAQGCTLHEVVVEDAASYRVDTQKLADTLANVQACYICNPNNPTGVLLEKVWIEPLIKANPHCQFVIDEAFMDWTDEAESVISLINEHANLFVLRSMTKMYAIAGVRLGYVIGQQAGELARFLPHWNVGGVAIEVGCLCLQEAAFVEQSRKESAALRGVMTRDLQQLGCTVSNSAANFLLFGLPQNLVADHFFKALLKQGIVLRHTENYVGLNGEWFRIAVKTPEIWRNCKEAIEMYVSRN